MLQLPTSCSYLPFLKLQLVWERKITAELLNSHFIGLSFFFLLTCISVRIDFFSSSPSSCRQASGQASGRWLLSVQVQVGETGTPYWRQAVPAPAACPHCLRLRVCTLHVVSVPVSYSHYLLSHSPDSPTPHPTFSPAPIQRLVPAQHLDCLSSLFAASAPEDEIVMVYCDLLSPGGQRGSKPYADKLDSGVRILYGDAAGFF